MATASQVHLSLDTPGIFHLPHISEEAAKTTSVTLQDNHDRHHVFYKSGFHNHIAHHLLTLYSLAPSPSQVQKHYDQNKIYQYPPKPLDESIVAELHDYEKFQKYLGNDSYHRDYLIFFQQEIEKKGYQAVINEHVLKGDKRADDMLVRMHAGFLHPIIHLGFGVEFEQPAIIAEALAQAAVHTDWIGAFLLGAEKAAASTKESKSLVHLLDEIRADKTLSNAAHWDDENKVRDGVMVRAPDEMIKYASQFKVDPDELGGKAAEMVNAAIYYTGSAQHPPKQIKFDFYYMHSVNCSIFYEAFLKQSWITPANKARLVEWKSRNDLVMYASRHSPPLLLDEVRNYRPEHPSGWDNIFERVKNHPDDGHAAKLIRALAHGEKVCKPFERGDAFRIKGAMWLQLGHMAIDSVEGPGNRWVRSCGFDEAWENFEDRPRAQL